MNEIALSSDLNQIELEINHHKNIAGQSIWEIGRRLNHVKENDLAHGEFGSWVESINMSRTEAFRFMKVATELPNVSTLEHLGTSALYLIATLPETERTKEHVTTKGEVKTPDEMTVKELQELKKQLSRAETQLNLAEQDKATKQEDIDRLIKRNNELINQQPKVIEVEKEVIPEDYQEIKSNLEFLEKRNDYLEQEQRRLEAERKEVNEKSQKYDQLTEAIHQSEGKLNQVQQKIADYNALHKVLKEGNDLLAKISVLVYTELSDAVTNDTLIKRELETLLSRFLKLNSDIRKKINNNPLIIEGEIIDD